jgi:16S rRNA (cytosine967-C5)-methyltransferase
MVKVTVRERALDIIVRVGESGGYSNVLIRKEIEKDHFHAKDVALLTELVYGTIQRKITLEFFLNHFVQKKTKPWVKWLLYSAFYQMQYLDRIPDHAVIHDSVEIAKKKGNKHLGSFVNGVLRNFQRLGAPDFNKIKDPVKRLSIETSHPEWMVHKFINWYGYDLARSMCLHNLHSKDVTVRVQSLKISREEAIKQLEQDGFEVEPSQLSNVGIIIKQGNIFQHPLFPNYLTVQDESSMLVGEMMDVQPGMKVLDACSAPGGKTTHIAELMKNEGEIFAYDLHAKKANLVKEKAKELGLTIIKAQTADSRNLGEIHKEETFDRILLDAPCSGLGVLRGKPDIKYKKTEQDIKTLVKIQLDLLESVSALVKKDGKIVYSTCTVAKEENEKVIQRFLEKHPNFTIDQTFKKDLPERCLELPGLSEWGLQLFPQDLNTDGFFLTRLVKCNK